MAPELVYAARAASRLTQLLNEGGYPLDLLERAGALSCLLAVSQDEAMHLLSGKVPWSWSNIARACEVFGRSPGYFLDERADEPLPSDIKVVAGVGGGESTVWRAPTGLARPVVAAARLRYVTLPTPSVPADARCLRVFNARDVPAPDLQPGLEYVIETADGCDVMKLVRIRDASAVFEALDDKSTLLVPVAAITGRNVVAPPRVIGDVIGTVAYH